MMKRHIIFIIFILLLTQINISYSKSSIFLEGLYATSIQFPHSQYGPEKLFDGNKGSKWSTMPGAGPDEGVMLVFEKPVFINKMELFPTISDNSIKRLEYISYVNGQEKGIEIVNSSDFNTFSKSSLYTNVKTLYVKIHKIYLKNGTTISNGIPYTVKKSISFSEIRFTDKNEKYITVLPPLAVKGSIISSSSLEPVESYHPDFLFDSRKDFGWADGHPKKSGQDEYLTIRFKKEQKITKIKIWNGYQRSVSHFTANERVKIFEFGLTGKTHEKYYLPDYYKPQLITLNKSLIGKSFTFRVTDIYKGAKYKDLCISELRFFDGNNWLIVDTGGIEKRKKQLIQLSKKSFLSYILDKQIVLKKNRGRIEQSIILRSNGSFVLWKKETRSSATKTSYADGNWQIKGKNRIRIFGRLHRIEIYEEKRTYDPYAGGEDEKNIPDDVDTISIFSDFITITDSSIRSQKRLFQTFSY